MFRFNREILRRFSDCNTFFHLLKERLIIFTVTINSTFLKSNSFVLFTDELHVQNLLLKEEHTLSLLSFLMIGLCNSSPRRC